MQNEKFILKDTLKSWEHLGVAIERGKPGEYDSSVTGDPCIVWDENRKLWHMFYFAQKHLDAGEVNCNAHAVSFCGKDTGPGQWKKLGPIEYENSEDLMGSAHKPWILMDPYKPNSAARINSSYYLFTPTWRGANKVILMATSQSLDGPWRVNPEPVVCLGDEKDFDGYHADTVTAYWFSEKDSILIFYKGYPREPQQDQKMSPYGSSTAAAVMSPNDKRAEKLGKIISPIEEDGHWMSGWASGIQIFPAGQGGWYGLLTGSPNPPAAVEEEPDMREPAPSLGGWAYTPEEWPVKGWKVEREPITTIESLPEDAKNNGEGFNLWRHHILVLPGGPIYLYYNSGRYGQERMFVRRAYQEEA